KETVPVVTGYKDEKNEAGSNTVIQDQPEVTDKVTYKALGKIIQVDEAGNVIPGSVSKIYENNPSNPTEAAETKIPDAPTGYKIKEEQPQAWGYNIVDKTIEPNDESDPDRISRDTPIVYVPIVNDVTKPTKPGKPVEQGTPMTPENPGTDTPIIYVPKTTEVTKPTKQTVTFEGAGDNTPAAKVQNDFTFTGKEKNGTTTWDQPNHTYGKETVPVVTGYYADKKEAGSKTVTPDQPEVTDKVTYKPLGKIIPVDPEGNPIPKAPTPQYNNDPEDPTKGGKTPTPVIPGYVTDVPNVTPSNPGVDTPVIYRKAEQKAIIKYIDTSANDKELAKDAVSGKSGEAINYSTEAKIADFVNKGYKLVEDGFKKATEDQKKFDSDTSTDQEFVVKLAHDETPVGPNDPHNPTDPINPNDPNSPKYPAEDQWKKDVMSTVKYVVSDGKATAPADNVQNAQWTRTLKLDKVTGKVLNPDEPWAANKANYDAVPTPGLTGYYADKASVASKTVTQENLEETVTYKPLGSLVPKSDDPKFPSTPDVKYPNDPTDPSKPGNPVVPDVPGYKPYLPDPKDPSKPGQPVEPGKELPNLPTNPGDDTPIIYVPIVPATPEPKPEPQPEPEPQPQPEKPQPVKQEPAKPGAPVTPQAPALPETGENTSLVATLFGGLMTIAGLGLAGKRKKED
ncbi:mucin-binding protein, partial [Streptococcus salivarius]|uniref:mucin-binding protein n=2 Tax=Streptococcus salivarius TaxID=1304 RepID=UPI0020018D28